MPTLWVLRHKLLAPVAALLLPAYLSACFQYRATGVEPLPGPRTEVKVHLAAPIQVPLGEVTLRDVTTIEGIASGASDDTLGVFAKWLYPQVGNKYDALGATFRVAAGNIAEVEQYRFSPQRTIVAVAITGAAIVGFLYAIGLAKFGGGVDKPPEEFSVRGWWSR